MKKIMLMMAGAIALAGCTPDNVIVTIPTSQVHKSMSGELGFATAKVTYSVMDNNGKKQLAKCKEVAMKYVGEGGLVDLSGGLDTEDSNPAYLTATFRMPIITPENRGKVTFLPPAVLMIRNGSLSFCDMTADLNKELKKIDSGIKAEFSGGKTTFRLVGDSVKPIVYNVFGTFLDNKPVVSVAATVGNGKEYKVLFHRSSEHIWHEIEPFINIMK